MRWRVSGNTGVCCKPRAKRLQKLAYSSPILPVKDGYAGMWTQKEQSAGLLLPKVYPDRHSGFDQEFLCIFGLKSSGGRKITIQYLSPPIPT